MISYREDALYTLGNTNLKMACFHIFLKTTVDAADAQQKKQGEALG